MNLSYRENISEKLKHFEVGDLVQYTSHSDGDCSWVSLGEYGIVVRQGRRFEDPDVEVLWTDSDLTCWVFRNFLKKVLKEDVRVRPTISPSFVAED